MEEEYTEIGKINLKLLNGKYKIKTDKLIITKERIEHINLRHPYAYKLYGHYIPIIIDDPDYILEDIENDNTLLYLKEINELHLQVIVKLQIEESQNKANSIITFWYMRARSYKQILNKNEKIYEKLDKNE